jgi:hypothetical protein
MEKLKKGMVTVFAVAILIIPTVSIAGDLEPPGPPGRTMHTLDEIYHKVEHLAGNPAPIGKTGQTTSYGTGDDGDLQKGVAWPTPRFRDNGNGTVTDNLTGLIWLKNANCFELRTWLQALGDCNSLANGSCGLSDGSSAGDWRLPNVKELLSLIDYAVEPALPNTVGTGNWSDGDPFTNVELNCFYWSSTSTTPGGGDYAWFVTTSGNMRTYSKGNDDCVWPVRGGN